MRALTFYITIYATRTESKFLALNLYGLLGKRILIMKKIVDNWRTLPFTSSRLLFWSC